MEAPLAVFNRLFGDKVSVAADVAKLRAQRKSVLDAVLGQFRDLETRLGVDDRKKLDAHAESLRSIEMRLGVPGVEDTASPSCIRPTSPGEVGLKSENVPALSKLMADLLAMAFACDLTRVASLQYGHAASLMRFPWLGSEKWYSMGHHPLSHEPDSNKAAVDAIIKVETWFAEQFAYLVGKLKATRDLDGKTVLDNTVAFWGNEIGKGNNHTDRDVPYVLAGKAGGYFRTGRYVTVSGGIRHNRLLVTLINSMGIPQTSFGKPEWSTGGALGGLGG